MTKALKKIMQALCWQCDGEFIQRNSRAHFCSGKCRVYFNRGRARAVKETAVKPAEETSIAERVLGRVGPRR